MTIRVLVTYFFTAFREVRWYSYNLARENPLFWLATRAGNIGPICPHGIPTLIPRKKKIFFQCNQLFFFFKFKFKFFSKYYTYICTYTILTSYTILTLHQLALLTIHIWQYNYTGQIELQLIYLRCLHVNSSSH